MKTLAIIAMLLASPAIAEGFQNPYLQPFNPMPDLAQNISPLPEPTEDFDNCDGLPGECDPDPPLPERKQPEQTLEEAYKASTDDATKRAREALNPPPGIAADIAEAYDPQPPLPEHKPVPYDPNEPEVDL